MLRDLNIFRRKTPLVDENDENVAPASVPFNAIHGTLENYSSDSDLKRRTEKTPSKASKITNINNLDVLRTPDKPPLATTPAGTARNRFGWAMKNDNGSNARKTTEDTGNTFPSTSQLLPLDRGTFTTPRICKTIGRTFSLNSECSSTQSTPNKSVCKPFNPALGGNRAPSGISHAPSSALCSKHNPVMANTVDVPHFEMKEDPSFWMDHNVQVILIFYPVGTISSVVMFLSIECKKIWETLCFILDQ